MTRSHIPAASRGDPSSREGYMCVDQHSNKSANSLNVRLVYIVHTKGLHAHHIQQHIIIHTYARSSSITFTFDTVERSQLNVTR